MKPKNTNLLDTTLYARLLGYAALKVEGFTYEEITGDSELALTSIEKKTVKLYTEAAYTNFNGRHSPQQVVQDTLFVLPEYNTVTYDNKYFLNNESQSKYIEILELRFARKAAQEARKVSKEALEMSEKSLKVSQESLAVSERASKYSRRAIWISASLGLLSIVTTIIVANYIDQTVEVTETQFQEIKEMIQ